MQAGGGLAYGDGQVQQPQYTSGIKDGHKETQRPSQKSSNTYNHPAKKRCFSCLCLHLSSDCFNAMPAQVLHLLE